MLAKSCPKVSLQSRLSRESYDVKFGMGGCARNNYGVTLISRPLSPCKRSRALQIFPATVLFTKPSELSDFR